MGKGDKKTKRGKIIMGSYGVLRPRKKKKLFVDKVPKPKKSTKIEVETPEEKEVTPKAKKVPAKVTKAVKSEKPKTATKKTTKKIEVEKPVEEKATLKPKTAAKEASAKKTEPKPKTAAKKIAKTASPKEEPSEKKSE